MIKFLEDLAKYCQKYNINFSELSYFEQKKYIKKMLLYICRSCSYLAN